MENLKSYASYFSSYLLDNLKNINNIKRITLFGSVSKNNSEKDSDVDIFIEIGKKTKKTEVEIKQVLEKFYKSREATLFKIKGIYNKINIKIGKLEEWKDLERSIASDGIILYGKYESKSNPSDSKHNIIIFWDKIGKNRGAFLNKIYGFKIKGKNYEGLLSKYSGKKLGKSCIMIPINYKEDIFRLIEEYQVNAKSIEVFV
jgi:predicted nucleotidyltransferase